MSLQSWVEILPDFSKLDGRVRSHLTSTLGDAGSAGAGSFGRSFKSNVGQIFTGNFLADVAGSVARGLGELIGTGIRAGIDYSLGSIDLASTLNESFNANKVTFGKDVAAQLEALGKDAPQRLALTRNAFAAFSTQFSAFAKTIRGSDVVGFIDELTTRGADFASVYDLEVSDALALFQSGLAGETEPLRKFGIDLSAASVESYAYANGIGVVGTELSEAEKQQARYGLLLEKTKETMGDNANTAGEYAGQQRRLNVALEEAQTKFGQALLPTALDVTTFANDELLPILTEALDKAGPALRESIRDALPEIKELISSSAELLPGAIDAAFQTAEFASFLLDADAPGAAQLNKASEVQEGYAQKFREWVEETSAGFFTMTEAGIRWVSSQEFELMKLDASNRAASDKVKGYWVTSIDATILELNAKGVDFVGIGEHYGDGLAEGLRRRISTVREAAALLANEAIATSRNVPMIKSPSQVMRKIGEYYGEGLALGITDSTGLVRNAATGMAAAGITGLSGTLSADLASASSSDRPIYMDGGMLFGWIRETANGEARLVVDDYDSRRYQATRGGKIN